MKAKPKKDEDKRKSRIPEKYRPGVERMKKAVVEKLVELLDDSEAQMQQTFDDYEAWLQMFKGTFIPDSPEGPFGDLYIPYAAKGVERLAAGIVKNLIPDRVGLEFFSGVAQPSTDLDMPMEELQVQAAAQVAAIRHDLKRCNYGSVRAQCAQDEAIFGNSYRLVSWNLTVKTKYEREPNPLYGLPPEKLEAMNADPARKFTIHRVETQRGPLLVRIEKGVEGAPQEVIPPFKEVPYCVREYDAPTVEWLNPFNVYPTEMDRNGLEDCRGAFVHDATNLADLAEDAITEDDDGQLVGIYRLDGIEEYQEENLSSKANRSRQMNDDAPPPSRIKRLDRHMYFGALDLNELCETAEITTKSKEFDFFCREFNADPRRLMKQKTVFAEMVKRELLIRFQPNPYHQDKIPIIHTRTIPINGETIGLSPYARIELPERIANSFARMELEQAQNLGNPPVLVYSELLDPVFIQETGGISALTPGMVIEAVNPMMAASPVRPLEMPSMGLEVCNAAGARMRGLVDELAGVPSVAAGNVGDSGVSARAVSVASASADALMQDKYDSAAEAECRMLDQMAALHRQFDTEARTVYLPGEDGKLAETKIPVEVWMRDVVWMVTGPQTVANQDVNMEYWQGFWQMAEKSGRVNWEEVIKEYARLTKRAMPGRFVGPPPQPDPVPARMAASVIMQFSELPPEEQVAVMQRLEIEVNAGTAARLDTAAKARNAVENAPPEQLPGALAELGAKQLTFPAGDDPLAADGMTPQGLLEMDNPPPEGMEM